MVSNRLILSRRGVAKTEISSTTSGAEPALDFSREIMPVANVRYVGALDSDALSKIIALVQPSKASTEASTPLESDRQAGTRTEIPARWRTAEVPS